MFREVGRLIETAFTPAGWMKRIVRCVLDEGSTIGFDVMV